MHKLLSLREQDSSYWQWNEFVNGLLTFNLLGVCNMTENFPTSQATLDAPSELQEFTVVKRNGSLVPFRRKRIYHALEAAFRDTKKVPKNDPLPEELSQIVEETMHHVMEKLSEFATKGTCLTVEGIQDIVEVSLMDQGHHDVARDYIIYRDQHKLLRDDSPQNLKVTRRDGSKAKFNPMKVAATLEKAFRHRHEISGPSPQEIIDAVNLLTQKVVARISHLHKENQELSTKLIQDEVENQLMREGFFSIAKEMILMRAGVHAELPREEEEHDPHARKFTVITQDGKKKALSEKHLKKWIAHACRGLEKVVDPKALVDLCILNFYEGIKEHEVDVAVIMAARANIENDPAYSKVASRLLLDVLYRESMGVSASDNKLKQRHRDYFKSYIDYGVEVERLSSDLKDFNLDKLADAMVLERDDQFYYLGLQNLYDRYFIHHQERRLETPQIFWMRVAMGLCIYEEEQKNERAIEFYHVLSQFLYTSATPTLFNSGTCTSQLSSCYLSTVMDDLEHIFKIVSDDAKLSKWAGGLGNDWTNVRATGARIKGTNGRSQGVIPFLKVANDTAVAVNQCFAPETLVYTDKGILPISEIQQGDLVLGIGGIYREVLKSYSYNQKDPMMEISVKHSIDPIDVTAGHPFYAIQNVPMEQSIHRTLNWIKKGKVSCKWVESGSLKVGDYIAQVIPKEVVAIPEFTEDDARLYGILLGDGHLSKDRFQWGISGNPAKDTHLEFVREYLTSRNIHFWETQRGSTYLQIHWASGRGVVRDATTGQFATSGDPTLPFTYEDLYNRGKKWIAPRLSHLPNKQTLALIQGLIETDGNISREKEITFCTTSRALAEGMRYQLLRMGVPSSGDFRQCKQNHSGTRSDGSQINFNGSLDCYDIRIPAVGEIAERVGASPLTKQNWLTHNGHIFTRVQSIKKTKVKPFVFDLLVEGAESYMTVSGLAHNGGKRKGALCCYLETWHLDIEDFVELRKNTGDERRRTHDMNTANWIPDLFMKRVNENGSWTLFNPSDVPDLHDLYGMAFEKRYVEYEKMVEEGKITLFKKVEALQLWRKMLGMVFETGHPWITFKDPSNIRSSQDHKGVVHSSNLCTEILLNTSKDETAVCNLGSINLAAHTTKDGLDREKLAKTIKTAVRMLDNVININFYPIKEARNANMRHRPIGLGMMGFQDALYIQNISYASHEAVMFADVSMELISYHAILASSELAKERGAYESYKGSKWDRGLLPIDTIELLAKERGQDLEMDTRSTIDWTPVRESIKKYGMRNSNTMAIAPTATISNITGITQSIEPMYHHLFVKSNLSGEFTLPISTSWKNSKNWGFGMSRWSMT